MWSCFPLNQLIRLCTAALGLSLVYRLALPSMSPQNHRNVCLWRRKEGAAPGVSSPVLTPALPQLHPTPQHCLPATVSLWQSPAALALPALGTPFPVSGGDSDTSRKGKASCR